MTATPNPIPPQLPATGYIRAKQLLEFVPFGRSTLWQKVRLGEFPAPARLSERITAWRCEVIRAWIDQKSEPAPAASSTDTDRPQRSTAASRARRARSRAL